jgi:GDP-L-fucose synthase
MEVDEFARALLLIVEKYDDAETINIGTGKDLSIKEISEIAKEVVGFQGEVVWDESKPDGTPRKLLDISKIVKLGYQPHEDLKTGITKTYEWFKQELVSSKSEMRL